MIPLIWFFVLKQRLGLYNAAAIAAAYGSVSAITFVTAIDFLAVYHVESSGFMIAVMALMEGPPIFLAVLLVRFYAAGDKTRWLELLHEALFNHAVFLLLGSLLIGLCIGAEGYAPLKGFFEAPFKGILCLFLLDMGLLVANRLPEVKRIGSFLLSIAFLAPLLNACLGITAAALLGLSVGNALLLAVLCAGASYIAVPAALSISMPQANPALYLTMSLAITFPFNIIVGIPLYYNLIQFFWEK